MLKNCNISHCIGMVTVMYVTYDLVLPFGRHKVYYKIMLVLAVRKGEGGGSVVLATT